MEFDCPWPPTSLTSHTQSATHLITSTLQNYLVTLEASSNCSCQDVLHLLPHITLQCVPFPINYSIFTEIFYSVLFTTTILLSLIGNATVLWIVLHHAKMRSVTNYYLLNLAAADISISLFNTAFTWPYNFFYHWTFGSFYCGLNHLMGVVPICASVFTMLVMSIDRYYAIVHPLKRRPRRKATACVIVAIWLLSFAFGLPALFASRVEIFYFFDGKSLFENYQCTADNFPDGSGDDSRMNAWYNNTLIMTQYVLPLLVLSWAYYHVGRVLRRDQTVGDSQHIKSIKSKKKAACMLGLLAFTFLIVWLPYHLYYLIISCGVTIDHVLSHFIYINIYWLAMSSTVVNPIILYFMNKRFRVAFQYAFRCMPCFRTSRRTYKSILSASQNGRGSLLNCPLQNTEF